jgi:hypothetical protein
MVEIVPTSLKQQEAIFTELDLAISGGYFKAPQLNIWTNKKSEVIYSPPPEHVTDILRDELSCFEAHAMISRQGRGRYGFYGSKYKVKNGQTMEGETKDDTVFAIGYAVQAAIRGDIAASLLHTKFPETEINTNVIGEYGQYTVRTF